MNAIDMSPLDPEAQACALAQALKNRGLTTALYPVCTHRLYPCVWAFSEASECTEYIYVAPDGNGEWYFWFAATRERISDAIEVSTAADKIAATLSPTRTRIIPVREV